MASWLIDNVGAISAPSGSAFDAAYLVKVARGSSSRDVVVEFAAPSAVASRGYAEEVARPFLGDEEPPEHLVVEIGGAVRVQIGPRAPGRDVTSDVSVPPAREPRRARNHRRS